MASKRLRLLTVIGTRPEIIKCSPLLPRFDAEFNHVLVHTGQHYDEVMDGRFFTELELRAPDANLAAGSGSRTAQLARMLAGLEPLLRSHAPDAVFVQGDTNSTLAGALAATTLGISVVHLEAGCRSFNRAMPEEINRVLVDHIATRCLAPDEVAARHLDAEGIAGERIEIVGSTAIDACLRITQLPGPVGVAQSFGMAPGGFLLATIHRAENTMPERLSGLMAALDRLSRRWPVLLPLHPRTAAVLREIGSPPGVTFCEPVGYPQMMRLLQECRALLTDSGGLQEEAAVLGTPTFILRVETEWIAFVEAGRHRLVGTDPDTIVSTVRKALEDPATEARMRRPVGAERAGASDLVMRSLRELHTAHDVHTTTSDADGHRHGRGHTQKGTTAWRPPLVISKQEPAFAPGDDLGDAGEEEV